MLMITQVWKLVICSLGEYQVRLREKGKSHPTEMHGERYSEVGKDFWHLFKSLVQFWLTQQLSKHVLQV